MKSIIIILALLAGCVKHEPGKVKFKYFVPAHEYIIWTWDVVMDMPVRKAIKYNDYWVLVVQPEHRIQYECQVSESVYEKTEVGSVFYCD